MPNEEAQMGSEDTTRKKVIKIEATTAAEKCPDGSQDYADEGRIGASFRFDPGQDIEDAVEKYGHDNIFDLYIAQAIVKAQAAIRRELESGTPPEQVGKALSDWRPDVQHRTGKDPVQSAIKAASSLDSEEDLDALLAQIQERKAALQG